MRWWVFDSTGVLRRRVTTSLPLAGDIWGRNAADLGTDHILARATDADGVESVRLYRLLRKNQTQCC
jgi:hypothetical protein